MQIMKAKNSESPKQPALLKEYDELTNMVGAMDALLESKSQINDFRQ